VCVYFSICCKIRCNLLGLGKHMEITPFDLLSVTFWPLIILTVRLLWFIVVAVLHMCKKTNSDRLIEVVDSCTHIIIGKFQIFGGHFEFCPLKNFPRGGLSGTFDMLFPMKFCIIWAIFQLCTNFPRVQP